MPAPKILSGLPKPALFGLYGAAGGLLGALLLGELIMLLLGPKKAEATPPAKPGPRLAVSASKEVQLYEGGVNTLYVHILRDEFEGPVTVRLEDLPPGVTAAEVIIPEGKDETEVELRSAFDAKPGSPPIKVVASARPGEKSEEVTATAAASLSILPPAVQADIVFVLDVTFSMERQIDGLQASIVKFAGELAREKVNARFGCVAFRDKFIKEESPEKFPAMTTLKFDGESFTSDANAFREKVSKLEASGGGDPPEASYEAVSEAARLKGWRKDAMRVLVLITDQQPKTKSDPPPPLAQSAAETAESLRKNNIDLLHLVVHNYYLSDYQPVRDGAKGVMRDGKLDQGKDFDFTPTAQNEHAFTNVLLPEMTKAIVAAAESKRPEAKPELTKRPEARPELPTVKAVQSSDSYEKGDAGRLVLAVGAWTGAIAALVCLALLAGQHHYLRGTLPGAGGVVAALGGGAAVGLIGGAAGQGLVLLANADNTFVLVAFRLLGWVILGALAGGGLSLFVPNLKFAYGLIGGAAGGLVGGVGYLAIERAGGAVVGRLAGGLVLGFCIGLMVAVVEAAFRRVWLEVRYGLREVVTVNLGAEPVKVGGDARACTVWARGAPSVALRYFVRNGKVVCADVPSREEEVVGDGDTREAGNVVVVVRTGGGSAPSSPARRPAPPVVRVRPRPAPVEDAPPPVPAANKLEIDNEDVLPLPAPVPKAPSRPAAPPPPARPPVPARTRPPVPAAAPRITSQPAPKPAAKDSDACPGCGRKNPGRSGSRYCMVCDRTY